MSKMSPHGTPKPSWKNGQRQPTLPLHVLSDQIHPRTQSLGLPRRGTPESDPTVCRWNEPASDCPSSRPSPSHSFPMGPSTSGQLARSTGADQGQGSGNGRVVHLYRGQKNQIFVITIVDRLTRCYLGFRVVWERTQATIQEIVDEAPKAKRYFSDAFDAYERLWYHWGVYEVSQGKTDTYSVEADNAELRHYLARLARRSRCFSRCPEALKAALKLFMYCFNRRQLHKQHFPNYSAHVFQFV
jgi:insertion element IS1 protein InsB